MTKTLSIDSDFSIKKPVKYEMPAWEPSSVAMKPCSKAHQRDPEDHRDGDVEDGEPKAPLHAKLPVLPVQDAEIQGEE
jgi:hypothetical protein